MIYEWLSVLSTEGTFNLYFMWSNNFSGNGALYIVTLVLRIWILLPAVQMCSSLLWLKCIMCGATICSLGTKSCENHTMWLFPSNKVVCILSSKDRHIGMWRSRSGNGPDSKHFITQLYWDCMYIVFVLFCRWLESSQHCKIIPGIISPPNKRF